MHIYAKCKLIIKYLRIQLYAIRIFILFQAVVIFLSYIKFSID